MDRLIVWLLGSLANLVLVEKHDHRSVGTPVQQGTVEPSASGAQSAAVNTRTKRRCDHHVGLPECGTAQPKSRRVGNPEDSGNQLIGSLEECPVGRGASTSVLVDAQFGDEEPVVFGQFADQIQRPGLAGPGEVTGQRRRARRGVAIQQFGHQRQDPSVAQLIVRMLLGKRS